MMELWCGAVAKQKATKAMKRMVQRSCVVVAKQKATKAMKVMKSMKKVAVRSALCHVFAGKVTKSRKKLS